MEILDNIRIEYKTTEPKKIVPIGDVWAIYMNKVLCQTFIHNWEYVYPILVQHEGKTKLAFYTSRPNEYWDKGYKIYFLKRNGHTVTYIPIPTHLKPFLLDGRSKNKLVNMSIGCDDKNRWIVFLERFNNG